MPLLLAARGQFDTGWCSQVGGTQATLTSPESYSHPAQPPMCLLCTHVTSWAPGPWDGTGMLAQAACSTALYRLQCTEYSLQTASLSKERTRITVMQCAAYMMLRGRRLIQATQSIIEPKPIARDSSANTADWLNCQYRRPRYYIVQYRYQYRPHLGRYPGIRYTGIPVLEALDTNTQIHPHSEFSFCNVQHSDSSAYKFSKVV